MELYDVMRTTFSAREFTGDPLPDEAPEPGRWTALVPLPVTAEPILGSNARIKLTVTPRQ